jgi:hypothetical protein
LQRITNLLKEFGVLDQAMSWAGHINNKGRGALLVETDDGTHLTKQQRGRAIKAPTTAGCRSKSSTGAFNTVLRCNAHSLGICRRGTCFAGGQNSSPVT